MNLFARVLFSACLALCASGCNSSKPVAPPKADVVEVSTPANVVLVTIDTTRADHLGCYGNDQIQTPNMDNLAREGVLFEEAFSVQPVTLPAHTSILTGKYPFRPGVRDNNIYKLAEANQTTAEVISENGYVTTAFVASDILSRRFGLQ